MSSGHAGRDLGRISHDANFVQPLCEVPGCRSIRRDFVPKATALRLARAHAAKTGHTVTLNIWHWQRVHPRSE